MKLLSRKQVIAILLKKKFQGTLRSFFKGPEVARAGLHSLQAKPSIESLQRAILATAPVESIKKLPHVKGIGGSTRPYKITLKGGQTAIFKPRETGGDREYLAYAVSKSLGFPNVPPTTMRRIKLPDKGGYFTGSIQVWIKGTKRDQMAVKPAIIEAAKIHRQSRGKIYSDILKQDNELHVFDYIVGNVDRFEGNMLWDYKKTRLIATDNADAFFYKGETPSPMSLETSWRSLEIDQVLANMPMSHQQEVGRKLKRFLRVGKHLEGELVRSQAGVKLEEQISLEHTFERTRYILDRLGKPPKKIVSAKKKKYFPGWE